MTSGVAELTRWRLILGDAAEPACDAAGCRLDATALAMDVALDWLYGRDPDLADRRVPQPALADRELERVGSICRVSGKHAGKRAEQSTHDAHRVPPVRQAPQFAHG